MYLKGSGGTTAGDSHLTCATHGWPKADDERLLERLGYSVCREVVASRLKVRRGVQISFMCICPLVVLDVLHGDLAGYGSTGHWLSAITDYRSSDPLWRQALAQPSFLTLTRTHPLSSIGRQAAMSGTRAWSQVLGTQRGKETRLREHAPAILCCICK